MSEDGVAHDRALANGACSAVSAAHRDRRPRRDDGLRDSRTSRVGAGRGTAAGRIRSRRPDRHGVGQLHGSHRRVLRVRSRRALRSCRCPGDSQLMSLPTWSGARHPPRYFATYENATLLAESLKGVEDPPVVATLGPSGVESHVPRAPHHREPRAVRDDDPLLVIFTSGSEASPKGAVLTHANCFWNNLALAQALPLTKDDVVLAVLPQFHVARVERAAAPGLVGGCHRGTGRAHSTRRAYCNSSRNGESPA